MKQEAETASRGHRTEPEPTAYVVYLTDEDIQKGLNRNLEKLGLTWEELKKQAKQSKFKSDDAREVWFFYSSFEDSFAA